MGIYAVINTIRIKSINSMKATTSGGKVQVGGLKFWTNCRAGVGGTFIWERQCTVIMIYHTW